MTGVYPCSDCSSLAGDPRCAGCGVEDWSEQKTRDFAGSVAAGEYPAADIVGYARLDRADLDRGNRRWAEERQEAFND